MTDKNSITPEQLRTVLVATELGGKAGDSTHFSYAELGNSTYSFGQMQFDVGSNPSAQSFLKDNGFDASEIDMLSRHGGLSSEEKTSLDTKLQAIPQTKMDQFTNQQLNDTIARVGDIINSVRKQNPTAAEAISKDQKLQLGIADYANQFSPRLDSQLATFLAGKQERGIHASSPPTRDDMQNFISTTPYGHDPANTKAVKSRAERFDEAMATLKLGPATKTTSHATDKTASTLKQGGHGPAVHNLQTQLADLGYLDGKGIDGAFGIRTGRAVERFQHDHRLKVDGIAGPMTLKALDQAQTRNTNPGLDNPTHADHALFLQAQRGVHRIDAQRGRIPDQCSDNLAAALTVQARHNNFTCIDQVALSPDGLRAFAVQNSAPTWYAQVPTAEAVQTSIEQSSATWLQVMQQKQAAQPVAEPVMQQSMPAQGMGR